LEILNLALTASDWIGPVTKAVADIIHDAGITHDVGKKSDK
jgi:hypothetical protein